ncbi:uncharacterized protein LOC106664291 [Cimex lectularius]|uniref:Uncharacterized protein n=1 Tax=Cimex lectularius TaxID=79782 RepID=A0A8I6RHQ1_CIMLE|nr:uncharacterized protein LOC106664291 [Cimex lectularius]
MLKNKSKFVSYGFISYSKMDALFITTRDNLKTEIEEIKEIKEKIVQEKITLNELMTKWNNALASRRYPLKQERTIFRTTAQARMLCRNHIRDIESAIEIFLSAPTTKAYDSIIYDWGFILKQLKITQVNFSRLKEEPEEEDTNTKTLPESLWWQKVTSERKKRNEEKKKWLNRHELPPDIADSLTSSDDFSSGIESDELPELPPRPAYLSNYK